MYWLARQKAEAAGISFEPEQLIKRDGDVRAHPT
jgi:hypothetical protein